MIHLKKCILLSLVTLVTACGPDTSNKGATTTASTSLDGIYTTECISDGSPSEPDFKKSTITISSINITLDFTSYSGIDCAKKSGSRSISGTFLIGTLLAGQDSINKFDFTYQSTQETIDDATSLQVANKDQFYGISDWTLGVPRDITGKKLLPQDTEAPLAKGAVLYSVLKNKDNKINIEKHNLRLFFQC